MKLYRLAIISTLALALVGLAGCGGNDSRDTEAPVFLSVEITEGTADVDISVPIDVVIGKGRYPKSAGCAGARSRPARKPALAG